MSDELGFPSLFMVRRDERGERIKRADVSEGDRVAFEWSPYDWWQDETDIAGRVKATVVRAAPSEAWDVTLELPDGRRLIDYGGGRRQVSGPTDAEDMPNRTDVGLGGRYYALGGDR